MPAYGEEYKDFLKKSESESYRAWGELLTVGVPVEEGLMQSLVSLYVSQQGVSRANLCYVSVAF